MAFARILPNGPVPPANINFKFGYNVTTFNEGDKSAAGWEAQRERILDLYSRRNLPLREVAKIMQRRYNFAASIKSFRDHIRRWGANNKNLREDQLKAVIRKTRQRAGQKKASRVEVSGRIVEEAYIERLIKRRKYDDEDLDRFAKGGPPTPKEVRVFTPPPSPTMSTEVLRTARSSLSPQRNLTPIDDVPLHRFFFSIRDFATAGLRSKDHSSLNCVDCPQVESVKNEISYRKQQYQGLAKGHRISVSEPQGSLASQKALFDLNRLIAHVKRLLVQGNVLYLYCYTDALFRHKLHPVVFKEIAACTTRIALSMLGPRHPIYIFLDSLSKFESQQLYDVLQEAMQLFVLSLAITDSATSPSSLHLQYEGLKGASDQFLARTQDLILHCDATGLYSDYRPVLALYTIGRCYAGKGETVKAREILFEMIERSKRLSEASCSLHPATCRYRAYYLIANLYYGEGNRKEAINNIWTAIHTAAASQSGWDDGIVSESMELLRLWLTEWDEQEALEGISTVADGIPGLTYGHDHFLSDELRPPMAPVKGCSTAAGALRFDDSSLPPSGAFA